MAHNYLNPDGVSKPTNYTHVVTAQGSRIVFIAGQVSVDKDGNVVGAGDLAKQAEQVYENLKTCLASVGATFADVTKLTTFIVSYRPSVDRAILGAARQKYVAVGRVAGRVVGRFFAPSPRNRLTSWRSAANEVGSGEVDAGEPSLRQLRRTRW